MDGGEGWGWRHSLAERTQASDQSDLNIYIPGLLLSIGSWPFLTCHLEASIPHLDHGDVIILSRRIGVRIRMSISKILSSLWCLSKQQLLLLLFPLLK